MEKSLEFSVKNNNELISLLLTLSRNLDTLRHLSMQGIKNCMSCGDHYLLDFLDEYVVLTVHHILLRQAEYGADEALVGRIYEEMKQTRNS